MIAMPARCILPARHILQAAILGLLMTLASVPVASVHAEAARATTFNLDNGMQVVVIPDRRAPVVTHMVWYRVGAADEPPKASGIAHFLEHLMFKATENMPAGEFSKTISRMGGQDNAFTSQDATAYFQRIARDRLPTVMRMEAERMTKLRLEEKEVLTERKVIIEERLSRTDNNPQALLGEEMNAALYRSHPYGTPIIGWMHEMEKLSKKDAQDFYERFYAPNNAILVVAGDVTADEVRELAKEHYGKIPPNAKVAPYARPTEPPQRAPRRMELIDKRAGEPIFQRYYMAPSYVSAPPGDAEALDLFMKIVASGTTSRMYKDIVVKRKLASSTGGYYAGYGKEYGRIVVYGVPTKGTDIAELEAAIDGVLADTIANGLTEKELERAKKVYLADYIYESDSQSALARRYGFGLIVGRTIKQIEDWPDAVRKVTLDDLKRVAAKYIDINASVTGYLLPSPRKTTKAADTKDRT